MQNLKIHSIVFSVILIFFSSCSDGGNGCQGLDPQCCSTQTFTTISQDELIHNMSNYRDSVWSKSSTFFKGQNHYDINKYILNGTPPIPAKTPSDFDARYLDISLDELNNYICALENNFNGAASEANVLRFFYIRYDDWNSRDVYPFDIPPNYQGMHSLAIVPVIRDTVSGETEELRDEYHGSTLIFSPSINHHTLCPPLTGCDPRSSFIHDADQ